ncbi:NB-ARC domain-containing protein [Tenacibaculum sp. Ill]|uniref:NB-ARC domain-containing protein n=1 Tax=Tenacibaculum sp. Ill TaxID=3445935 RepID=UPI003F7B357F
MSRLREHFINTFATEISSLNGTDFEYLCKPLMHLILKDNILHKGHNLYGKPVGYTADFIADDYKVIGQCGTEPNYFSDFSKPIHDIDRCIINHSKCKTVYLFANQRASGGKLTKLDAEITKKNYSQTIEIYDSEKLANIVIDNITNSSKVEEVLNYLPKTFEYYKILPQTNKLPSFKNKYHSRNEENVLINKLANQDFIQIYGISGIGKSELSISIGEKLKENFDSVIWVDGDEINEDNLSLTSIQISKFKNKLNLNFFLQEFKVLLIVDNLNSNVLEFIELFKSINKKKSKCIITSLQRDLGNSDSFALAFLDDQIAKDILLNTSTVPTTDQIDIILNEIKGYPLVLNLIKSSIEVDEFTWEDIINEIDTLKDFTDSKNQKLSKRIIGKFLESFQKELQWISALGSRKISRHFLLHLIGKRGIIQLEKRSLIHIRDLYFYDIHQLILDSIISEVGSIDQITIQEGLKDYLFQNNEIKSIGYFNFMLTHNDFVNDIFNKLSSNSELRKIILYAFIQTRDSFNSPEWFIKQLKTIDFSIDDNYYDLLLFIELAEIELFQIEKKSKDYSSKCNEIIESLKPILNHNPSIKYKTLLLHHLGKFYLKNGNDEEAEKYFQKVINLDSEADYCRLQLARLYANQKKLDKCETEINFVLDKEIELSKQSLAILLSFYELLSKHELGKLRTKFIDRNLDTFVQIILNSIDSSFEQTYRVIEKLSSHLSYMLRDTYTEICDMLPFPSNIDENRGLRFAFAKIKLSQYKLLKYSENPDKNKMDTIFDTSLKYFKTIDFDNDFERKQLLNLYIASGDFESAFDFTQEYEKKEDPFYLQTLCKIERGRNNLNESLKAIDLAISNGINLKSFFKAAFLNDKAETLFEMKNKECIAVLNEAIELQNTEKTKDTWNNKLNNWKEELK